MLLSYLSPPLFYVWTHGLLSIGDDASLRAIFEYDEEEKRKGLPRRSLINDHQSGTLELAERSLKREKQSFEAVELNVGIYTRG